MNHKGFMRLAVDAALRSKQPVPCGVAVVYDGKLLVSTFNKQRELTDATAHAEILAIREAGRLLHDKKLAGCSFYCTCEPCVMCLAALSYTAVEDIYIGATMDEAFSLSERITITAEDLLTSIPRIMRLHWGVAKQEVIATLYS